MANFKLAEEVLEKSLAEGTIKERTEQDFNLLTVVLKRCIMYNDMEDFNLFLKEYISNRYETEDYLYRKLEYCQTVIDELQDAYRRRRNG